MELYYFIAQTYSGIPAAQKAIKNAEIVAKKYGISNPTWIGLKPFLTLIFLPTKKTLCITMRLCTNTATKNTLQLKQEFKQYLNQFSIGFFTVEANYYLAYSCLFLKDTQQALPYFSKSIAAPAFEFKEDVANHLTNVYAKKSDCVIGFQHYELLEKYSTNPINSRKAVYHRFS